MADGKLEKLNRETREATESNRSIGVIDYESRGQKKSGRIFEVERGLHYLPDGQVLGPGQRFHPLEGQVRETAPGRFALAGKARELTGSELTGVKMNGRTQIAGADIGLRALPFSSAALKLALDEDLKVEDFKGVEPAGSQGKYTKAQVQEIVDSFEDDEDDEETDEESDEEEDEEDED